MSHVWRGHTGPLLYAHRGAHVEWPENSLPAFRAALAAGADVIESDVHMTRDGHVVMMHDASGARVAGTPRAIGEADLQEVKGWDLGAHHPRTAASSTRVTVPTLDEVLDALPEAAFNLDVKQVAPDMTDALLSTLENHGAQARVLLTSFDEAALSRLRVRYSGPMGLSRGEAARALFAPRPLLHIFPPRGGRLHIPRRYGLWRLDRRPVIAKMHALGIKVDYWVVDEARVAARLLERGADGIVTDDVVAMARLFSEAAETVGWRVRHSDKVAGGEEGTANAE